MGSEVITSPFTFAATCHSIVWNGLVPVFCDIEEENFTIDPKKIEALITPKTKAILGVHVYGFACKIEEIAQIAQKYDLKVIYDAAHAFNTFYNGKGIGNYGDATVFSFHSTKLFNTVEGGLFHLQILCFMRLFTNFQILEYQMKNMWILSA